MLLNNEFTLVNQIMFILTFDNDVRKLIVVKTDDIVDISYTVDGGKERLIGRVDQIQCNLNSSLGRTGSSVSMKIDGSDKYCGLVKHIKPEQVLDLTIVKTSNEIANPVCSVDNEGQKVILIRENEVGTLQYSIDGIRWKDAGAGAPGLSAFESAVKLGFSGTEQEWIDSLKGKDADSNMMIKVIHKLVERNIFAQEDYEEIVGSPYNV